MLFKSEKKGDIILIKILAIGNSFSQDATYYLHDLAACDQIELKVVNLYIGGSNLERHWNNIMNDTPEYLYEKNGESSEQYVSVKQVLDSEEWDYIVTQQASYDSGLTETYYPFIEKIFKYITEKAPKSEFLLQETWAYETDSNHDGFVRYDRNQRRMYEKLSQAYRAVADKLGVRLIPCGDIIQNLRGMKPFDYEKGGMSLCRDGFHMDFIYGRYLLAAVWYKFLIGNSVVHNSFMPQTKLAPNTRCEKKILDIVKHAVDEAIC